MDELIVRALQGETSEIEERRLAAWRGGAPENEQHFLEVQRIWTLGEGLRASPIQERVPTIQELALHAPVALRRASPPSSRRSRWSRRSALAAALFLLGFAASYAVFGEGAESPLGVGEFVTNASETVTVTLGDGTIVRLAPQSRMRLTGTAHREVWLDGRAYFAVAKQEKGRNFRVRTHAGDAVVLGTRFDLQARDGTMRLLVVEGEVEVGSQGRSVAVTANEVAEVTDAGRPTSARLDEADVQRELGWMGDFLIFTATPLEQVARELSARYGVPVEVLDSALAQETVHGWFADQELGEVLQVVCRAVRAHCTVRSNGATIEP